MSDPIPNIRPLDPMADGEQVIELFDVVFGHTVSVDIWYWKYMPPWTKRHYCWVLEEESRIVGYLGAVPLRGQFQGKPVPFFQFADFMVHPDHRAKHSTLVMGPHAVMDDLSAAHERFLLYGFSNHRAFRFLRGRIKTGLIERTHYRHIEPEAAATPYTFKNWAFDEPLIDTTWETMKSQVEVGLVRDRQYLKWRYGSHPINNYQLFGVFEGDAVIGWVVLAAEALKKPELRKRVPAVDMLLPMDRCASVLPALATSIERGIQTWIPATMVQELPLSKDSGTHAYHFKENSIAPTGFLQEHLFFTMGDVDWW